MPPKPILGIIGSIGAGKSLVASLLVRYGGLLIVADALGHEGLRHPAIKEKVKARWGEGIFKPDGEIDRKKLGAVVFADANELKALEAIQFPYIGERVREEIAKGQADPAIRFIVLDAAVLLEAGWKNACDRILFVDAPREVRLRRLIENRKWTADELDRREGSQMPLDEKRKAADAVLVNAGREDELPKKLEAILRGWIVLP